MPSPAGGTGEHQPEQRLTVVRVVALGKLEDHLPLRGGQLPGTTNSTAPPVSATTLPTCRSVPHEFLGQGRTVMKVLRPDRRSLDDRGSRCWKWVHVWRRP